MENINGTISTYWFRAQCNSGNRREPRTPTSRAVLRWRINRTMLRSDSSIVLLQYLACIPEGARTCSGEVRSSAQRNWPSCVVSPICGHENSFLRELSHKHILIERESSRAQLGLRNLYFTLQSIWASRLITQVCTLIQKRITGIYNEPGILVLLYTEIFHNMNEHFRKILPNFKVVFCLQIWLNAT